MDPDVARWLEREGVQVAGGPFAADEEAELLVQIAGGTADPAVASRLRVGLVARAAAEGWFAGHTLLRRDPTRLRTHLREEVAVQRHVSARAKALEVTSLDFGMQERLRDGA